MVLSAISFLLLLGYAVLIRYYYGHFKKLPLFSPGAVMPQTFVSVIIAARNEAANLPPLMHALAAQTYPPHLFEVILVDDFSTDNTMQVVRTFSKVHVAVLQPAVPAAESSKKKAIETGVQKAKGPLLLITDADCIPPPRWIETLAAYHEKTGAVFIAAPVKFTHNHTLLQRFQAVDFLVLQGITAASVAAQFHTMCNGANLAYTKRVFEAVNGFEGINHIASGDDMLLMHKIWLKEKEKVQYVKSNVAIVATAPMHTWKAFVAQRKRWASKTAHYNDKRVFFVLVFVYLLNCWFFVLLMAALWNTLPLLLCVGFLISKTAVEWPFAAMVADFYKERRLMRYFLLFQPLHITYTVLVGFISQLGTYEWKGRKTK
jgi:cellulose synthase/poly-beta-1,6-N-acetylglucosamine synthase-like glycosyltransferase